MDRLPASVRTPPERCLQPRQLASSATAASASVSRATLARGLRAHPAAPSPLRGRHPTAPSRGAGGQRHTRGLRAFEGDGLNWPRGPRPREPDALLFGGRSHRARATSPLGGERKAAGRRPRFLCLHGFRTSAEIMRRQVVGRWPAEVTARLDLVFADGPFPARGTSPVAGVFDPPYYEWCQFVGEDFLKCRNLDRCFSYLEELMIREGPFDGLLGFSQGAGVSAVLAGLQQQGLALTGVAKVKYVVAIAGAKIQSPAAATRAFASKIQCPSLHFIGDDDFVKVHSEELVGAFADPLVIRHPCGHTIPKLDGTGLQVMLSYLDKIERELSDQSSSGATEII